MTLTRAFKRRVCRVLVGALLFSQFAVASYACPALTQAAPVPAVMSTVSDSMATHEVDMGQSAVSAADGMMDCDQMPGLDPDAPNLCFEHCHHGQQSDQTQVPAVPAVVQISFFVASAFAQVTVPMRPNAASDERLAAAFPPHAILYCSFLI